MRKLGQVYYVFVHDSEALGGYRPADKSTSYAAACAIAQRLQEEHGLAFVDRPDGTRWYPPTYEEEG